VSNVPVLYSPSLYILPQELHPNVASRRWSSPSIHAAYEPRSISPQPPGVDHRLCGKTIPRY
jgi:hypothetical protein